MGTARTGRTHGCSDQRCKVKILLANPEPSTHGPSRHFACGVTIGRYRGEADIKRQQGPAGPVENDPIRLCVSSQNGLLLEPPQRHKELTVMVMIGSPLSPLSTTDPLTM